MLTSLASRVLGPPHASVIAAVLAADPYAACVVAARFDPAAMTHARLGGEFWGISGGRAGLCFAGSNLVPLAGDDRAMRAFAAMAVRRAKYSASVSGRQELVTPLWEHLEARWGPARAIRWNQPFLICADVPHVEPDPLVRVAHPDDMQQYYPASVSMFTEEIGIDPRVGDGGRSYRTRVAELVRQGRAFCRIEGGQVVFKAELGSLSPRAALIQGVWVAPHRRGEGLAAAGIAAVVRATQQGFGRLPCLYVNDFNLAARAAYARVGFSQIATYTSVLL